MQSVHLLAVGNLREAAFASACGEYQKRLRAFCRLAVTEISEYKLPKAPSDGDILRCLEAEGKQILDKLSPRAYTVAMCIEGKQLSSPALAGKLEELAQSYSEIAFVIGGSHGLSREVKDRAQLKLSMSEMTFPHQLARVMLLEQIYRGFSINNGSKYHK